MHKFDTHHMITSLVDNDSLNPHALFGLKRPAAKGGSRRKACNATCVADRFGSIHGIRAFQLSGEYETRRFLKFWAT